MYTSTLCSYRALAACLVTLLCLGSASHSVNADTRNSPAALPLPTIQEVAPYTTTSFVLPSISWTNGKATGSHSAQNGGYIFSYWASIRQPLTLVCNVTYALTRGGQYLHKYTFTGVKVTSISVSNGMENMTFSYTKVAAQDIIGVVPL